MFVVKRENWKGKFVVVSRDKGRLVSWTKWTPKFPIERQRALAKLQGGSLKIGVTREVLSNVTEIVDESPRPRRPRNKKYQYFVKTIFKKKEIVARSQTHNPGFPISKARDEALESLYERIAQAAGMAYDADEGLKVFEEERLALREGVVYYTSR